jgi:hypothetical protein
MVNFRPAPLGRFFLELAIMQQHRNVEFSIVQTSCPTGWKWTMFLDADRTKTGHSYSRDSAIVDAQQKIDSILDKLKPE